MVSSSIYLRDVYRNDSTVQLGSKIILENNMNMMIDGITVTSAHNSLQYTDEYSIADWPAGKPNPFKKLFPLDSVVKAFRPTKPGVNYNILGDQSRSWNSPRTQLYTSDLPRMYYPGVTNTYKYWIAPFAIDADMTVRYRQTEQTWKDAILNGDLPANSGPIPVGNKSALANKILVQFETHHAIPATCIIKVEKDDGTFMTPVTYTVPSNFSGTVEFFYNGSTWATTEPENYSDPILIRSINVKAELTRNDDKDRIAIIEVSARYIKSVSENNLQSMEITKQASSSNTDLLPVGYVNSNTLTLMLSDFNESKISYKEYNRASSSFAVSGYIDPSITYLTKNTKIIPYFKTYHSNGSKGSIDKYDETQQGIFYIDTFVIDEYGTATISCLDGAKQLMETLCPDMLLEKYAATAILRALLDMVGFTNYNFNLKMETTVVDGVTIESPDKSIPQIGHWWTTDTQTVWEAIQEICRDIQMNAFFDEAGVLQFYSRDNIYSQTLASWTFRYNQSTYLDNGVQKIKLPNIINFSKQEIAAANQVKILWNSPVSSNYLSNSTYLWQSGPSYLSAGGLRQRVPNPVAKVTSASSSNGITTYIADNEYVVGQVVSVSGLSPNQYNISNLKITDRTDTSFSVAATITQPFVSAGAATTVNITGATYANGYTTYTANNSFVVGDKISVSGVTPGIFNFLNPAVISDVTSTSFKVKKNPRSTYVSGGIAKLPGYGTATITPESTVLIINTNTVDRYQQVQSIYNFAGYFLIDSEIIEFDAIQYQYTPILTDTGDINEENLTLNPPKHLVNKLVWITSQSDISKYQALAKVGFSDPNNPVQSSYFKPTGVYRIKTRGAFGTTPAFHNATSDSPAKAWIAKTVSWTI